MLRAHIGAWFEHITGENQQETLVLSKSCHVQLLSVQKEGNSSCQAQSYNLYISVVHNGTATLYHLNDS